MKRLIDREKYNRALTGCSIPGDNGIFERGFNAGLNVAWNLLSVMPGELPEMKATVTVASHGPAVFGEWYKPADKLPESEKLVLVEYYPGMLCTGYVKRSDNYEVWLDRTGNVTSVIRWCYLPEIPQEDE